ncbi:DNA-binding protein [Petrachloros mirabilis]
MLKTPEEVREELAEFGITVSAWARARGFSPGLVHQVLAGRLPCKSGQSHDVAVELGLKFGRRGSVDDLSFGHEENRRMNRKSQ